MCLHIDWEPWCLQVHRPRDSVVLGVKTVARGPLWAALRRPERGHPGPGLSHP